MRLTLRLAPNNIRQGEKGKKNPSKKETQQTATKNHTKLELTTFSIHVRWNVAPI